jgi:hypothetical protein
VTPSWHCPPAVVLVYQAWTYHVFRGRLGGSPVGGDEPGPVVPTPRREHVAVGPPAGSGRPPAAGTPAPPPVGPGTGDVGARHGQTDGATPVGRMAAGGIGLLAAWLLLRQQLVSRARPR